MHFRNKQGTEKYYHILKLCSYNLKKKSQNYEKILHSLKITSFQIYSFNVEEKFTYFRKNHVIWKFVFLCLSTKNREFTKTIVTNNINKVKGKMEREKGK